MTNELSQCETLRQVLEVENMIEDGCEVLLDKEQTLVRQGKPHVSAIFISHMVILGHSVPHRALPVMCIVAQVVKFHCSAVHKNFTLEIYSLATF